MILFGFPHCGDFSESYQAWSDGLPASMRFHGVELLQTGMSMREVHSDRWEQGLQEACSFVQRHLVPNEEYVFIGHCWGSLLAFEASHRMRGAGLAEPSHLFLSGCSAPHTLRSRSEAGGLQGSDSGCQPMGEYRPPVDLQQLRSRISVFTGNKDEHAMIDQLAEWSRYTSKICDVHVCEGNHAFWQAHAIKWLQVAQTIVEREYVI
ncbi:thioesterase II family protein [Paenibacillus planticolens]|uniref:thioesterase II family protein n=1 Tax=Paenibacillus planticolens TaxID=2654976 RepID=UPI0028AFC132|nr:thioesterase domain-containing protein [Paenibacillus planticolens]